MARNRDDQRETQGHIPFPDQPRTGSRRAGARTPANTHAIAAPKPATTSTDSALQTLADIGTFRSLKLDDLATYRHAGDRAQANAEVRNLVRQGLLRVRTMHPSKAVYAALTRDGHSLLNLRRPAGSRQVYYAQFVKPRELRHDAAIYRLYQEVAARIAREGGRVQRVVLDFELKKSINPRLAKLKSLPEPERSSQRQKIAAGPRAHRGRRQNPAPGSPRSSTKPPSASRPKWMWNSPPATITGTALPPKRVPDSRFTP